jgi:hypothetical protein
MSEPSQELRKEVIKHSAAIQIHNKLTLLQSKAWSWLLYHAYDELQTCEVHSISVRKLKNYLEYQSNDEGYLKEIIRALVSCQVEWNILDKDDKWEWGVAAILAQVKIRDGVCTYAFAPEMRQRLYNPNMYAKINLLLQNKFASKHALALWELCTDYLGAGREYGETPFIAIEQFRKLVGLENSQYAQQFKILNRDVIKPAVAEINRVSDLRVTVDYQRQGRRMAALKFHIYRVLMLSHGQQPDLFPDLEDMPIAVKAMTDAGLPIKDAMAVWQKGFDGVEPKERPADIGDNPEHAFTRYVREKIHLLEQRQKGGKVENPAGFLLTALKKNYTNAKFVEKEARNERQSKVKELRTLKDQKEKIERERDDVLQQACDKVIEAFPGMAERAAADLQGQNNVAFRHCYDPEKSAVENYKSHRFVAETIGQWLESQLPEDFEKKKKPFRKKLEAIDARIKVLESEGVKAAVRV